MLTLDLEDGDFVNQFAKGDWRVDWWESMWWGERCMEVFFVFWLLFFAWLIRVDCRELLLKRICHALKDAIPVAIFRRR